MFDRHVTVVHQPHRTMETVKTVNIHEHRAPTDDSLKLLNEMREKVQAEMLATVRLETNHFSGVWHMAAMPMVPMGGVLNVVRFIANGQTMEVRLEVTGKKKMEDVVQEVMKAVSDKITTEMLREAFYKVDPIELREATNHLERMR